MPKQKTDRLTVSYDKDADVLYVTKGKSQKTIGEMLDDGIIVRRDPKTKEIVGFTILDSVMKDNPTITRIRKARMKISARFGHDIEKLGRYYMKRQKRHRILANEAVLKKDWDLIKENKALEKI